MSERLKLWFAFAALAALVGFILLYPDIVQLPRVRYMPSATDIPPAFAGNRAAYAFALFSMFSMTSLAIRQIILIAHEMADTNWREEPDIGLYRIAIALLMASIVTSVGPDVLLLLLWGEAERGTIVACMTIDRICDGLALAPFLGALHILVRVYQLRIAPLPDLAPTWLNGMSARERALFIVMPRREGLREQAQIVVAILVIALGLAALK